jgi:hypothetical protein
MGANYMNLVTQWSYARPKRYRLLFVGHRNVFLELLVLAGTYSLAIATRKTGYGQWNQLLPSRCISFLDDTVSFPVPLRLFTSILRRAAPVNNPESSVLG